LGQGPKQGLKSLRQENVELGLQIGIRGTFPGSDPFGISLVTPSSNLVVLNKGPLDSPRMLESAEYLPLPIPLQLRKT
jgi:hypothetical protein